MRHVPFDCVALYRLGDFYVAFGDDAERVARALQCTITRCHDGDKHAGFPADQRRQSLAALLAKNIRVMLVSEVLCHY